MNSNFFPKKINFLIIFLIFFLNFINIFISNANIIETPMSKPNESVWRNKSNIMLPANKPDPALFMMSIPSDVTPPLSKPDPKSIFPEATKSLTEMVFLRTNIVTEREKVLTLKLEQNEGINPLLQRGGFNSNHAYSAVLAIENIADLRKLPVGLEVRILSPENNKTGAFTFKISKEFNLYAILDKDLNWVAFKASRPIRNEILLISGEIKSSLYLSAQEVDLPEDVLMEFVQLMGYSVDFQRQIHPGDKFKILFHQTFDTLDNKRLGLEKISYAELDVSGEKLKFFRYVNKDGIYGYFDKNGQSARKALMRTPINGARLSSGFGMRKHPIKGFTSMHKGVDFGAPYGTPVFAAGDGILEKVGWINGYGRYILIRHNSTYKTAYAHLNGWARGIRRGARVSQGQTIGYVGSSGRSTGPHLHYEIIINGKQSNPLGVKMPSGKPVPEEERGRFMSSVNKVLKEIEEFNKI